VPDGYTDHSACKSCREQRSDVEAERVGQRAAAGFQKNFERGYPAKRKGYNKAHMPECVDKCVASQSKQLGGWTSNQWSHKVPKSRITRCEERT